MELTSSLNVCWVSQSLFLSAVKYLISKLLDKFQLKMKEIRDETMYKIKARKVKVQFALCLKNHCVNFNLTF